MIYRPWFTKIKGGKRVRYLSDTWHYEFQFGKERYRASTGIKVGRGVPGQPTPFQQAKNVENAKRLELARIDAGLQVPEPEPVPPEPPKPTFAEWATQW